jgi:hypothetical protein
MIIPIEEGLASTRKDHDTAMAGLRQTAGVVAPARSRFLDCIERSEMGIVKLRSE